MGWEKNVAQRRKRNGNRGSGTKLERPRHIWKENV
jgi:hypothetical protein